MVSAKKWCIVVLTLFSFRAGKAWQQKEDRTKEEDGKIIDGKLLLHVHWMAPFLSGGGYCSEAMAFLSALHAKNNISLLSIGHHGDSINNRYISGLTQDEKLLIEGRDITKQKNGQRRLESKRLMPMISVCHSEPGAWSAPTPKYHTNECPPRGALYTIGRTMFETDRLPSGWSERLNYLDEIWVPTNFSRDIFEAAGVDKEKLIVLGEPIDTDFYAPLSRNDLRQYASIDSVTTLLPETFVFLFVGKWEKRKGITVLLRAYMQEFSATDNVALVILTNAYHSTDDFDGEINKMVQEEGLDSLHCETDGTVCGAPKIVLLTNIPQIAMPALYTAANVLVMPSHGEGWGRPHVEAMSVGIPVIATNWSGPTEFMTNENGYLLSYAGLIATPGWAQHFWAQPSEEHLRSLMRHTYTHPSEALEKGNKARADMISRFSLSVMGDKTHREFDRIKNLLKAKKKAELNIPKKTSAVRRKGRRVREEL